MAIDSARKRRQLYGSVLWPILPLLPAPGFTGDARDRRGLLGVYTPTAAITAPVQVSQSTIGFIDDLALYLENVPTLQLTRGTNLFASDVREIDLIDEDIVAIYDDGYEPVVARHLRVLWDIRFSAVRNTRNEALEALRPITMELHDRRAFTTLTEFKVLSVALTSSPVIVGDLDNHRHQADTTVTFQVIPPFRYV